MDDDQWHGYRSSLQRLLSEPDAHAYWKDNEQIYSPSLREFVAKELGV